MFMFIMATCHYTSVKTHSMYIKGKKNLTGNYEMGENGVSM